MKTTLKVIALIWLLVIGLFTCCPSNDASAASATPLLSIASTFSYDRQDETTITYDGSGESVISYDAVCVLTDRDKENGTAKCRVPFTKFSEFLAADTGATFGKAVSTDYRATFFEANPELEGQVVVHHAVEQQTLTRYPGVVTEEEIHSLENLRGIPNEINSDVHLSQIRREWNQFYRENPAPTQQQLLQKATEIDAKFGSQFKPPVGGGH